MPVPERLWDAIISMSHDPGTAKPPIESSSSQSSNFNFLGLPIELQILIVREYLDLWPILLDDSTPCLIQALRGQTKIYEEALAISYSSKQFSISMKNEHSVLAMPKSIQTRMTNVILWYGYVNHSFLQKTMANSTRTKLRFRGDGFPYELVLSYRTLSKLRYSNIRTLTLCTTVMQSKPFQDKELLISLAKQVIIRLPSLTKFTLEINRDLCLWETKSNGKRVASLLYPLKDINRAVGVFHQWVKARNPHRIAVLWEAENNEVLTWTDTEYWRSIKWRIALSDLRLVYRQLASYHIILYVEAAYLYFLGLNPRRLFYSCRQKHCLCSQFFLRRVTSLDNLPVWEIDRVETWREASDKAGLSDRSRYHVPDLRFGSRR